MERLFLLLLLSEGEGGQGFQTAGGRHVFVGGDGECAGDVIVGDLIFLRKKCVVCIGRNHGG